MSGMPSLEGKVAVVTGGASGIGRGMAEEFLACGARVVIADIEQGVLAATAAEIGAVPVRTDVANIDSVKALAGETLQRFGRVDIVCNNAGVGPFSKIEAMTLDDWKFIIDVNLWGVIHGVNVFLPHLIGNAEGGHIVNTASQAGLEPFMHVGAYTVTKYGVVALSESLAMELAEDHPKVGVTVLCPGPVHSQIHLSQRNRPASLAPGGLHDVTVAAMTSGVEGGARFLEPREVGALVAKSIRDGRLYAITHPELFGSIRARHARIAAAYGE
jgi:NAD(P)-dependent dehydrogenase (short-subunit alcohol dehydrogenase family)